MAGAKHLAARIKAGYKGYSQHHYGADNIALRDREDSQRFRKKKLSKTHIRNHPTAGRIRVKNPTRKK